jgi:hypothetical protein
MALEGVAPSTMTAACAVTSAALLQETDGFVPAGGYFRWGSLFFAVSSEGGGIKRIVYAAQHDDIPALGSKQWRSLGHTADEGMYAAHFCHRERKPTQLKKPSGFWPRFAALFNDLDLRPLAERMDCRDGLRFLRVDLRVGPDEGAAGEGTGERLIFDYGGVEFGLNPSVCPSVATHVQLPGGLALGELPLLVPALVREAERDFGTESAFACTDIKADANVSNADADAGASANADVVRGGISSLFRVGGINNQRAIDAAAGVSGTSFAELTERMQPLSSASPPRGRSAAVGNNRPGSSDTGPGQAWHDYSVAGFLKRGGSGLKAQLLADNALVLGPLAMSSHQALVGPLLSATRLHRAASHRLGVWVHALRFRFNDKAFTLLHVHSSGCQQSPFMDGTASGQHFCLVNQTTKARLNFEGLAPVMAFRYGFYQSSRYRLEPSEVKRVLHG